MFHVSPVVGERIYIVALKTTGVPAATYLYKSVNAVPVIFSAYEAFFCALKYAFAVAHIAGA